jgi:hypothetical protein
MGDDAKTNAGDRQEDSAPETVAEEDDVTGRGEDRSGISDFVRRAVSAGVGAASRSKDDIMRAAAGEVRTWLEHLNFNDEVVKALAKMVIEVKTEIRFRATDEGKLVSETSNDVKVKPSR